MPRTLMRTIAVTLTLASYSKVAVALGVNGCMFTFYDRAVSDVLSVKNQCMTPIWVYYRMGDEPIKIKSKKLEILSGEVATVGLGASEVEQKGGIFYAACDQGKIAYESDSQTLWVNRSADYVCR
jgi:hypothetical protein